MTAKSCLIVILHMLFFSTLSAQYISIPDTLVTWEEGHMSGGDCQGYIYYHDKLYTYGPPVYAYGHKYTYVKRYREEKRCAFGGVSDYYYTVANNTTSAGYFRSDTTGKYFWRLTLSSTEVLLYDYALQVGDSIGNTSFVVYNIDSLFLGGMYRKRFFIRAMPQNLSVGFIIEGIGSSIGFLLACQTAPQNETVHKLICMSVGGIPIYTAPGATCNYYLDMEEMSPSGTISIFPNPASDNITILTTARYSNVSLFNVFGQAIMALNLEPGKNEVDIGFLPLGIYFINGHRFVKN